MTEPASQEIVAITLRTLGVCLSALLLAVGLGMPVGIWLGRRRFRGRASLIALFNSGMGAPPVVIGLVVALLLWRSGPLGDLEDSLRHIIDALCHDFGSPVHLGIVAKRHTDLPARGFPGTLIVFFTP